MLINECFEHSWFPPDSRDICFKQLCRYSFYVWLLLPILLCSNPPLTWAFCVVCVQLDLGADQQQGGGIEHGVSRGTEHREWGRLGALDQGHHRGRVPHAWQRSLLRLRSCRWVWRRACVCVHSCGLKFSVYTTDFVQLDSVEQQERPIYKLRCIESL